MNIGENVEALQQLINTPLVPPPAWARGWQTEAEHILHLAHEAKSANDLDKLKALDVEAARLVKDRQERT